MKYILSCIFLTGCGLLSEQVIEDVVEGEVKVAEKVVRDVSGNQPSQ